MTLFGQTGFSKFDGGTGALSSPFEPLVTVDATPPTTVEVSFTNHYGFSPVHDDTRLISTSWGALGGKGVHRWSGTIGHLDAFGIWREIEPAVTYSIAPTNRIRMQIGSGIRIVTVPDQSDIEYSVNGGAGYIVRKVTAGVIYKAEHLSSQPERSIPQGELTLVTSLNELCLGSQGFAFRWNHTDREGAITVSESFSPVNWCRLGVTLSSSPFTIGLSAIFGSRVVRSGVLFSRHPILGWSETAAVSTAFQK